MKCELLKFSSPSPFGGRPAAVGSYQFDIDEGVSGILLGYVKSGIKIIIRRQELEMLKRILFKGEEIPDPEKKIEEELKYYQREGRLGKLWKSIFS